jgi:hypothetical protein
MTTPGTDKGDKTERSGEPSDCFETRLSPDCIFEGLIFVDVGFGRDVASGRFIAYSEG